MVATDQDNPMLSNELPTTLRDLLKPIKQTALRMKQLSQLNNEVPHNENVYCQLPQNNDFHEPENVLPICQLCAMKFNELQLNLNDTVIPREDNVFEKDNNVDGQVFLRILSKPNTETQEIIVDPFLSVIQQMISNMSEVPQEVPLCKNTKQVCQLCSGCLKRKPITTIIDESSKLKEDNGVQFKKSFRPEPDSSIFDDDSLSVQSYELVKTMDVACECKAETMNDELCFSSINNRHEESNCDDHDKSLDPLVLNILRMLTNDHTPNQLEHLDPIYFNKPKSQKLRNNTSEVSSNRDKSIDCTRKLNDDSKLKSANKIEVTDELLNVATSTYSISILGQINSVLQTKSVKGQTISSSTQYDVRPEYIQKIPSNTMESQVKPIFDSRKVPKIEEDRNDHMEIIEKPCPCRCGYFLEGDSNCSCGCAKYSNSPCIVPNNSNQIKYVTESTNNSSNNFKTSDQRSIKSKKSTREEINSQLCNCNVPSTNIENIPLDPIVKRMNDIIEIQNSIFDSEEKNQINLKHLNDNKQLDSEEEEARKLQEKIELYRMENEYFRKLIQQACNGCQENAEILSRSPPIRATNSGLATAIEILQAKCRSKDSIIAILAEGLRGVINCAQIAKNLAAPCLEYSYWDFDRSALYAYLRNTMSKLSLEENKNSTLASNLKTEDSDKTLVDWNHNDTVPPPMDFKIVQEFSRCLFLSWKIPNDIRNVDGYRIYANGNLTNNVRSSKRSKTILGPTDMSKAMELKLHSFNNNGILSDSVTINYSPKEQ
ncbi:PREDICTED: protein PF14_0175-like [Polistes dominula]|uniref:Protein PF14_0175-like n=1 Tax=Polistes dominula TaxID=743375 RepID=A0ABM1J0L6_POLDO|nr:PREDICTED: protein PF14_0175-like [Polistes dominula]